MKITDIKAIVVGNPWKNWIFIKVFTDEGIEGLGEVTSGLSTKPIIGQIEEIRYLLIGEDPHNIPAIHEKIYKALFLKTAGVVTAGIDVACWDIVGKELGTPVYQLLGGKSRDKIRVYANGWYQGPREPKFFAERAMEIVKMGYTALKFDPFGNNYMYMSRDEEKLSMSIVEEIRDAVGESADLLIEAHDRFAISQAVRIGQMLEEYSPMWFETPVLSTDITAVNEVARKVNVPVIAGERANSLQEIGELLAPRMIDMINPEFLEIGGISGLMECFAIAKCFNACVAPHNAQSPFCTAVNVHVGIVSSNLLIQECFDDNSVEWTDDVLQGYPRVVDGYISPANAPGIGVILNEKEAAKHPYSEHNFLRLFDKGWERRNSK